MFITFTVWVQSAASVKAQTVLEKRTKRKQEEVTGCNKSEAFLRLDFSGSLCILLRVTPKHMCSEGSVLDFSFLTRILFTLSLSFKRFCFYLRVFGCVNLFAKPWIFL